MHVNPSFVTSSPANWNLPIEGKPNFFLGLIKGVGEVFIITSMGGIAYSNRSLRAGWRFGVYAIIGTFVSWLTAYSLGVDVELLDLGLYNYNAVLTMIAVGLMFDEKNKFPLMGIFAAAMTYQYSWRGWISRCPSPCTVWSTIRGPYGWVLRSHLLDD